MEVSPPFLVEIYNNSEVVINDEIDNEQGFVTLDRFHNSVGFLELMREVLVILVPEVAGMDFGSTNRRRMSGL